LLAGSQLNNEKKWRRYTVETREERVQRKRGLEERVKRKEKRMDWKKGERERVVDLSWN
jgi:hypothetical protein